jgi:hypothetical protein
MSVGDSRQKEVLAALLQLLKNLGLLCHPGKCELEPKSEIDFLGMKLDIP